jgi:hypothetical protein
MDEKWIRLGFLKYNFFIKMGTQMDQFLTHISNSGIVNM